MKRSELVPGVLIQLPRESFYVHLFQVVGNDTIVLSEWGYKTKGGRLVEFIPGDPSYGKVWHVKLGRAGFRLWQVTGREYLYSRPIPFSALTKVEIPSPATNPITNMNTIKPAKRKRFTTHVQRAASVRETTVLLFGNITDPEVQESKRRAEISGRKAEIIARPPFDTGVGPCGKHVCNCEHACEQDA